ncbi:MAG TPA: NlpC/P60 family protein [Chitinophagaceae bacterium]|nr:C40 family peptidase [Chitinophagaceae bacterium]HQV06049.1 NlpC/P60 family protein [Chitinophagaceae bacterium]
MVKQIIPAIAFIFLMSSCSSFKPLGMSANKPVTKTERKAAGKMKFIENIAVIPHAVKDNTKNLTAVKGVTNASSKLSMGKKPIQIIPENPDEMAAYEKMVANLHPTIETATAVQLKYAVLMDTEVESLPSENLLEAVDKWYGVRYVRGGNTTHGVDCSGFTVGVYAELFGMQIPRVSREQYRVSEKLPISELAPGDLVFFNTTGRGVSHVGIYLGQNKFIHASVSRGVMVNDLSQNYYRKRYIGGGRIGDDKTLHEINP